MKTKKEEKRKEKYENIPESVRNIAFNLREENIC